MRLEFENSRRVLELVMLCLPGGGGCGTESEARALPRQMRQIAAVYNPGSIQEPPASAVARAFCRSWANARRSPQHSSCRNSHPSMARALGGYRQTEIQKPAKVFAGVVSPCMSISSQKPARNVTPNDNLQLSKAPAARAGTKQIDQNCRFL